MEPTMRDYCCDDCLILLANGEVPPDWSDEQVSSWLDEIDERTNGFHVALACVDIDGECGFSWSSCDVCGSNLGGTRHPVVFFDLSERK